MVLKKNCCNLTCGYHLRTHEKSKSRINLTFNLKLVVMVMVRPNPLLKNPSGSSTREKKQEINRICAGKDKDERDPSRF
jgi:hypothetical protein